MIFNIWRWMFLLKLWSLERRMTRWTLGPHRHRAILATPDLCIFPNRSMHFGVKRYVKKGATKGIALVNLGWLTISVRC